MADKVACRSHFPSLLTPVCSHACLTLVRKAPKFNHPVVNLLFAYPLLFPLARRQEDSRGENRGQGRGPLSLSFTVCVCVCARARASVCVSLSLFPSQSLSSLSLTFSPPHLEYIFLSRIEFVCIHTHLHSYRMCFLLFFWGGSQQKKSMVNPLIVYREGYEIQFRS